VSSKSINTSRENVFFQDSRDLGPLESWFLDVFGHVTGFCGFWLLRFTTYDSLFTVFRGEALK
jgi:hypothetical protein